MPQQIYRRRRAAALAAVAVVTAGVVGGAVYLTVGSDGDGGGTTAGGSSPDSTSITTTTESGAAGSPDSTDGPDSTDSADRSDNPEVSFPPEDAVTGGVIGGPPPGEGSGEAGGPPSDQAVADGAVPAAGAGGSGTPACSDQSLAIKAVPDSGSYTDGSPIGFTVVITNIATAPCERDLGSGMQQVLVQTLDGRRLWSSLDCFPAGESDLRVLEPGQQAKFTVQWSGATSEPGCQAPRTPVGVGEFVVIGQLGELRSGTEQFRIV